MADWWAGFERDPRDAGNADLRAADKDRDVVRQLLTEAFADGRLDREEFDERAELVARARTLGDLPPLVRDLVPVSPVVPAVAGLMSPAELQEKALERWRSDRREAAFGLIAVSTITTLIWALTMRGGFFWPAIVMAAAGLNLLRIATSRQQHVADNLRALEKEQAKQLRKRGELPPS